MKLKFKMAGVAAALALAAGAVPMTVSPASAIPQKQKLDKKKWWPPKPATVAIVVGIGAAVAAIVLLSNGDDSPTSP